VFLARSISTWSAIAFYPRSVSRLCRQLLLGLQVHFKPAPLQHLWLLAAEVLVLSGHWVVCSLLSLANCHARKPTLENWLLSLVEDWPPPWMIKLQRASAPKVLLISFPWSFTAVYYLAYWPVFRAFDLWSRGDWFNSYLVYCQLTTLAEFVSCIRVFLTPSSIICHWHWLWRTNMQPIYILNPICSKI